MSGQTGWDREQAVRRGDQNLMGDMGYSAGSNTAEKTAYQKLGKAFEEAIQSDIGTPIVARIRIQRSKIE